MSTSISPLAMSQDVIREKFEEAFRAHYPAIYEAAKAGESKAHGDMNIAWTGWRMSRDCLDDVQILLSTVCELQEELDAEKESKRKMREGREQYKAERDQLRSENADLQKSLADCVQFLEGELLQKFGKQSPQSMHPETYRVYCREMTRLAGFKEFMAKERGQ